LLGVLKKTLFNFCALQPKIANVTFPLKIHQYIGVIGAANIEKIDKIELLVLSVCITLPIGATGKILPIHLCSKRSSSSVRSAFWSF
jgi:hypothetical protein